MSLMYCGACWLEAMGNPQVDLEYAARLVKVVT